MIAKRNKKFHSLGYYCSPNLSFCQSNSADLTEYSIHCSRLYMNSFILFLTSSIPWYQWRSWWHWWRRKWSPWRWPASRSAKENLLKRGWISAPSLFNLRLREVFSGLLVHPGPGKECRKWSGKWCRVSTSQRWACENMFSYRTTPCGKQTDFFSYYIFY